MDSAKAMVKDLLLHTGQSCRQGYFQILKYVFQAPSGAEAHD